MMNRCLRTSVGKSFEVRLPWKWTVVCLFLWFDLYLVASRGKLDVLFTLLMFT